MQLVNAGDGTNRLFIVQKGGTVLVYNDAYQFLDTFCVVANISSSGERGLLSLAFHPDYVHNGLFYVYYNTTIGSLELARFKVSANNANKADTSTKVILKTIPHPGNSNHNGGELHFGHDGYLYLSTGDGGGAGDVPNNAQNLNVLLGKMLRFNVDTSAAPYYTIPPGNPFGNEIYAYGFRNPFRWSFDRQTHDMWIGDVGQDSYEEINFRPADSIRGSNFGWRCYEGFVNFNTNNPNTCTGNPGNYVFPAYAYSTQNPAAAITGGTVYRGFTYPDLKGYYIGADFYSGIFYKIKFDSTTHLWVTALQTLAPTGLSDFGESEDGELYAVSLTANNVSLITASGAVEKVYTFNGNGDWTNAANWTANGIPPAALPSGSGIVIDPVTNGNCILNTEQRILNGARITVRSGKQFTVNSNLSIEQ